MTESKTESVTIDGKTFTTTFKSGEGPYEQRNEKQTGNNLFQDTICKPFEAAREFMKANPRVLTARQQKQKAKNRAKRKAAKRSR